MLQVLANERNLTRAFWSDLNGLDFETVGFVIVLIFLLSWVISLSVWKYKRLDELYVHDKFETDY